MPRRKALKPSRTRGRGHKKGRGAGLRRRRAGGRRRNIKEREEGKGELVKTTHTQTTAPTHNRTHTRAHATTNAIFAARCVCAVGGERPGTPSLLL